MLKRSRRGKMVVAAVVLAAVLIGALGMLVRSVWAEGEKDLGQLLQQSGLKFRKLDKDAGWVVPFDAGGGKTVNVLITYTSNKKKFAMIFATVVDKDDKYEYGKDVLLEAMKLNNQATGCKFCLDYDNGDIDCQSEVYMATLTPETLDLYVNLVAQTANEDGQKLSALVK